jgi:hypothetical protein
MAAQYKAAPVAIMLLVDNNRFTQITWPDLRDHCLPSLFNRLATAYPLVSITTFIRESFLSDQVIHEAPPTPRMYYTLEEAVQDVHFNATPNSSLTSPLIHEATKFLSSITATAHHLIIIGTHSSRDPELTNNWHHLAQNLALRSIYCHLFLPANAAGPTQPLNLLFNETLRLQKLTEENCWFSNDRSKITPRLSSVRSSVPPQGLSGFVLPIEVFRDDKAAIPYLKF